MAYVWCGDYGGFCGGCLPGGAAGIRATGTENIKKIKERVNLPIIEINKQFRDDFDVYITPTYESAREILEVGTSITRPEIITQRYVEVLQQFEVEFLA